MNQLNTVIKRWWVALIFGILAIALGIYIFFNPLIRRYKLCLCRILFSLWYL